MIRSPSNVTLPCHAMLYGEEAENFSGGSSVAYLLLPLASHVTVGKGLNVFALVPQKHMQQELMISPLRRLDINKNWGLLRTRQESIPGLSPSFWWSPAVLGVPWLEDTSICLCLHLPMVFCLPLLLFLGQQSQWSRPHPLLV